MLDTSIVPEGRYGLSLTVIDPSGNYGEPFEIWWTVKRWLGGRHEGRTVGISIWSTIGGGS